MAAIVLPTTTATYEVWHTDPNGDDEKVFETEPGEWGRGFDEYRQARDLLYSGGGGRVSLWMEEPDGTRQQMQSESVSDRPWKHSRRGR